MKYATSGGGAKVRAHSAHRFAPTHNRAWHHPSGELQLICILAFHAQARRGLNSGRSWRGQFVLVSIIWGRKSRPLYGEGWQGFLMYYSKGDAIGTRVSVRYRRSGRLSEVVVKRGSTVNICPCRGWPFSVGYHSLQRSEFRPLSEVIGLRFGTGSVHFRAVASQTSSMRDTYNITSCQNKVAI